MKGHRVLIVEDEILIALELQRTLTDAGATVVGPAMTVLDALHLINTDSLTAAILDVRLGREKSLPVAQRLAADAIPFVLYTANFFGRHEPPPPWPPVPIVRKPVDGATLLARLEGAVSAKH
jgi:CheY-like chemotaxis protein